MKHLRELSFLGRMNLLGELQALVDVETYLNEILPENDPLMQNLGGGKWVELVHTPPNLPSQHLQICSRLPLQRDYSGAPSFLSTYHSVSWDSMFSKYWNKHTKSSCVNIRMSAQEGWQWGKRKIPQSLQVPGPLTSPWCPVSKQEVKGAWGRQSQESPPNP